MYREIELYTMYREIELYTMYREIDKSYTLCIEK